MEVKCGNEFGKSDDRAIVNSHYDIFCPQACRLCETIRLDVGNDRSPAPRQAQACCQRRRDVLCFRADRHSLHVSVFAIPAEIVNFDYQHLRKYGHVQRVAIGAKAQNITPTLAAGLGLARSWGAIISNIKPDGLAEAAGLRTEDIVVAIDDRPIVALPEFVAALYLHPADQVLKIDVLRGTSPMSFRVPVTVYHDAMDELSDVPDLQKNLI